MDKSTKDLKSHGHSCACCGGKTTKCNVALKAFLCSDVCLKSFKLSSESGAASLGLIIAVDGIESEDLLYTPSADHYRDGTRKLSLDQVLWTRALLVSIVNGLDDRRATKHRLMMNQMQLANRLLRYEEEGARRQLEIKLKRHAENMEEYMVAAKQGQSHHEMKTLIALNADSAKDLAQFLAPFGGDFWSEDMLVKELQHHVKMTINETDLYVERSHSESIKQYDAIQVQAIKMSDYLCNGYIEKNAQAFKDEEQKM